MKLKTQNDNVLEPQRGGGRKVVVVGVKVERRSRDLLTWSLMKVAQPGDLVVALHVVVHDPPGVQASLMSMAKTFDSALAVYQGFCHLKQVDLKLKVSKGSSVRKALIEEARMYRGATLIVGTAKNHHGILLPTSIAKHCARKLSPSVSVVAVHNGKIVFQRKATFINPGICKSLTSREDYLALSDVIRKGVGFYMNNANGFDKHLSSPRTAIIRRYFGCGPTLKWPKQIQVGSETKQITNELDMFRAKYSSVCTLFKYKDLLSATSGFLPERVIGRGGSSRVFKGRLSNGKEVAVKVLKPSEEALKEFTAEIETITPIRHKNIVSLLGFCIEQETPILVYNILPRGSLEHNLRSTNAAGFGWDERYRVALGVAEALCHLHNGSSNSLIIHRDVKSSNILLDEDFEPQLADFGLATRASSASLTTCTSVAGTFGYLAPEYLVNGKVTEKIDVYAFGVVLLELLSGRKPIDSRNPQGRESLVMWATPILKAGKISQLVDPGLNNDHYAIQRMALAAALCIERAPLRRPRISIVLKILRGDPGVSKWAARTIEACSELDVLDGEASRKDMRSHLNTAFLDLEEDVFHTSRTEVGGRANFIKTVEMNDKCNFQIKQYYETSERSSRSTKSGASAAIYSCLAVKNPRFFAKYTPTTYIDQLPQLISDLDSSRVATDLIGFMLQQEMAII